MAKPTIVNRFGTLTGWNRTTFNWYGRDVEGITELAYDDNVDWTNEYAANKMPIGEGEGNYEAKASVTLLIEEMRAMSDKLKKGERIQEILGEAIVEYEYGGKFYKDVIYNIRIKNRGVDVKQGDKKIATKHELKTSHIDWNV